MTQFNKWAALTLTVLLVAAHALLRRAEAASSRLERIAAAGAKDAHREFIRRSLWSTSPTTRC